MRYTGSAEQIATLKLATLSGKPLSWIDGLRAVNPKAYHYFYQALQVGAQ
ncbi:MAG: hypothetical protein JNJ83_10695 [Verrucomicrobiaceae bacterium]|nr:hypothetical protein [Verrucomicrobiaceae bacterium]